MSHIFAALKRFESEQSGIEYPAVTPEPTDLLKAVDLLQVAEAPQSTRSVEAKPSECLPKACCSCGASVPAHKLFCPKCDSFQGSVATSECHDDRSQSDAGHLAFPEPPIFWIRALWPQTWAQMPRWMAIALPAGLMLLAVLAITVHKERPGNPGVAIPLSDGAAASSVLKLQPKPEQTPVAPEMGQSTQITSDKGTAPSPSPLLSEVGTATGGLVQGPIAHQVLPEVAEKARNSIHGTLMVRVRVTVDPSGKVARATFDSPGSSKYFANLALQAARLWEFAPVQVDGRDVSSEWILRFEFQKTATKVLPLQIAP